MLYSKFKGQLINKDMTDFKLYLNRTFMRSLQSKQQRTTIAE